MPSFPNPAQLARMARDQAEALAALPGAMLSLTRAVSRLDSTLGEARDAIARLQHLGERLEGILDEVEQPIRDLGPGIKRVGAVLDDPIVSEIPDTVRRLREDVLPLIATLRGTSDMFDRFAGRGLLSGRRRPDPTATAPVNPAGPVNPPPARQLPEAAGDEQ
jgi:ABC-type transporter Mla subunit MlaD